jgi:hypothetical protein
VAAAAATPDKGPLLAQNRISNPANRFFHHSKGPTNQEVLPGLPGAPDSSMEISTLEF